MLPQRSASSLGRPTRTELALLLAARPEPLRERMESADGNDTHEPGRDRDVRSASAANGLTFMTAPATSANPTTHVQVSSGLPGASDASLCVEVASPSAMTPTIIASAHARAADAGNVKSGCKRCAAPNSGRAGRHTCGKERPAQDNGSRERSSRKRMLCLPGPPEPRAEPTPPRVQPPRQDTDTAIPQTTKIYMYTEDKVEGLAKTRRGGGSLASLPEFVHAPPTTPFTNPPHVQGCAVPTEQQHVASASGQPNRT